MPEIRKIHVFADERMRGCPVTATIARNEAVAQSLEARKQPPVDPILRCDLTGLLSPNTTLVDCICREIPKMIQDIARVSENVDQGTVY